jgi:hypothetical protein
MVLARAESVSGGRRYREYELGGESSTEAHWCTACQLSLHIYRVAGTLMDSTSESESESMQHCSLRETHFCSSDVVAGLELHPKVSKCSMTIKPKRQKLGSAARATWHEKAVFGSRSMPWKKD